ncbi:hypothetical protein RB195_023387 [Necator americanus]|uniref:Uncharacterized protein n=1 Tax=Necator americanus TaxID=51031 RepID=A0ABR1EIZ0_NECAM
MAFCTTALDFRVSDSCAIHRYYRTPSNFFEYGVGKYLTTPSLALKTLDVARSINVITLEKEALISGTRIENAEGQESAFLGYTSRGVSVVLPNRPVRVVLFGFWLDELQTVSFTITENCSATPLIFDQVDFVIQTDKRVVVSTQFPEAPRGEYYRLCIKSRSRHNTIPEFLQVCEVEQ